MRKILPPILFMVAIMLMVMVHIVLPVTQLIHPPYQWFGIVIICIGLGISTWHNRLFDRIGTNIYTFKEPGVFVTEGLFQISRNPMYLGFVLSLIGVSILLGSLAPFTVVALFVSITDRWYISFEERAMAEKFGQTYLDYKRRVRRWI